jgi:transcriptional regulator with XRE-family HTH domain
MNDLRAIRRRRGLSQRAVAELSGMSPGLLSMIETGKQPLTRIDHLIHLARVLQVAPSDLVPELAPD